MNDSSTHRRPHWRRTRRTWARLLLHEADVIAVVVVLNLAATAVVLTLLVRHFGGAW